MQAGNSSVINNSINKLGIVRVHESTTTRTRRLAKALYPQNARAKTEIRAVQTAADTGKLHHTTSSTRRSARQPILVRNYQQSRTKKLRYHAYWTGTGGIWPLYEEKLTTKYYSQFLKDLAAKREISRFYTINKVRSVYSREAVRNPYAEMKRRVGLLATSAQQMHSMKADNNGQFHDVTLVKGNGSKYRNKSQAQFKNK